MLMRTLSSLLLALALLALPANVAAQCAASETAHWAATLVVGASSDKNTSETHIIYVYSCIGANHLSRVIVRP